MKPRLKIKGQSKIKYWEHKEGKEDEVFLGLCNDILYDTIAWKTKRKGKINSKGNYPLFIKRKELEEYDKEKFQLKEELIKKKRRKQ
ncbi:MAG: hypothetical protein RBR32_07855 [Bacteroidales bacterium]|nr:hypothetical protein [Bacteroidales bacterium]